MPSFKNPFFPGKVDLGTTDIIEEDCSATDAINVERSGNINHPYITLELSNHVERLKEVITAI